MTAIIPRPPVPYFVDVPMPPSSSRHSIDPAGRLSYAADLLRQGKPLPGALLEAVAQLADNAAAAIRREREVQKLWATREPVPYE